MAWGDKKTTRDDTNHPTPRKLPPNGWSNPEQRAADAAIEELRIATYVPDRVEIDDMAGDKAQRARDHADEMRRLADLEKEMDKPRIEQIKEITSKLTYGEMMSLAEAWAEVMPSGTVDKDSFKLILPPTLHAWTKT